MNDQKPDLSWHERQKWRNFADAKLRGTETEEKLADKITVSQVQVQVQVQVLAILPADAIVNSANELVRAQSELKTKEVELQTAKKEAECFAALNATAGAIRYKNAMANLEIAKGVAKSKVHTIVVPYAFKGIVNAKKLTCKIT